MSQSSESGRQLFDQFDQQVGNNELSYNLQNKVQKDQSSVKRSKKHKKDKHKNKKRHMQYDDDEQDEQNQPYGDMFEDQASQHSEQSDQFQEEDLQNNDRERRNWEEFYSRKKPQQSQAILNRLKGKSQREINEIYKKKLYQNRQNQVLVPSNYDNQTYVVYVKIGKQQQIVFSILKKTQHYRKTKNDKFKIQITSAMAMKKKYPGKIFIEAANEKVIRQGLQGFIDVSNKKITKLQHEDYINLFVVKESDQINFQKGSYIRIKKGLYEGDLGKINQLHKNTADVILVPRINIQQVTIKIKQQISKLTDEKAIFDKKQQMLKRYLNPRTYYPPNLKPTKKIFENDDPFVDFDVPSASKIKIQKGGLIILKFRFDELSKLIGSVLPVQIAPFSQDGRLFDQLKVQKIITSVKFQKGQEAQIIAGQLAGYFGTLEQIKQNTAVIKCRTKGMEGIILQEPLDHLAKRFKQGERVKVTSGTDKGKTGIILKLQGKHAQIWTDNQNTIKINKNNLQRNLGQKINQQNVHNLKKDDLIKTSKNVIGIVLSTTKDNIKILDMNNTVQIINNLDFDSKINSSLLLIKNKNNEQIRNGSIVRIKQGILQGVRCVVKHVYKDYVFLFNESLDKTSGVAVEKADNCSVLAKTSEGMKKQKTNSNSNINRFNNNQKQANVTDDQFKVGKSIIISTGPLKGYRGIIKSINKDRIEVRVPQKSTTEWITRNNLVSSNNQSSEMGKTPRRMGMSTYQQPGMSPNNYYHN